MRSKRIVTLGVIIAILALALITATAAAQQDITAVVQAYKDAYNSHDIDAVMALFAEDAKLTIVGMATLEGKEQIRGWHEYEFALNGEVISTTEVQVEDDTVTAGFATAEDLSRALGLGALHGTSKFQVKDGLIQSKTIQLTSEDLRRYRQAFSRLPKEVLRDFTYSAEYAQTVLEAARALPKRPPFPYMPVLVLLVAVALVAFLARA